MLENYFPVLLFIVVALAMGVAPMLLGWLAAPNRPDEAKLSPGLRPNLWVGLLAAESR